jgi:hypothetical protein
MRQAVRLLAIITAFSLISGCDQINGMVKAMQPTGGFPDDLQGLMAKSVPVASKRITYPRLAVAMTDTHESKVIGAGTADCGHFKITEWQSASAKQVREFDACVTRDDEKSRYHLNTIGSQIAYMTNLNDQWAGIERFDDLKQPDYQPLGTHWTDGPKVAQFFLPPTWLSAEQSAPESNLVQLFLSHVGVVGSTVDPRVWFYQIDQSN